MHNEKHKQFLATAKECFKLFVNASTSSSQMQKVLCLFARRMKPVIKTAIFHIPIASYIPNMPECGCLLAVRHGTLSSLSCLICLISNSKFNTSKDLKGRNLARILTAMKTGHKKLQTQSRSFSNNQYFRFCRCLTIFHLLRLMSLQISIAYFATSRCKTLRSGYPKYWKSSSVDIRQTLKNRRMRLRIT